MSNRVAGSDRPAGEVRALRKEELGIPLTDEQFEIVRQPASAKILVTAGPGTGKTHVLTARLAALVSFYDVSPGQGLLLLTFSRAAVATIRERVKAVGGDVAFVRAYTFDSFATRLLSQFKPEGDWVHESYDGRIKRARELIRSDEETREYLAGFEHLLVDEMQDLVGERSDFMKAILDCITGFTLLGDPAQGIYDFQLKNEADKKLGSMELYLHVELTFWDTLLRYTLTVNHRIRTAEAGEALWAGSELNSYRCEYGSVRTRLRQVVEGLQYLEGMEAGFEELRRTASGEATTAVLCRTNGQALWLARELGERQIPHVLIQSATDRSVAAWVGELFGCLEYTEVTKKQFEQLAGNQLNGQGPGTEEAWKLLKRTERKGKKTLDLTVLADRIRRGDLPDELTQMRKEAIVISTIHRAKGREFDRVILLKSHKEFGKENVAEEARVLYVALTRARSAFLAMEAAGADKLKKHWKTERWVLFGSVGGKPRVKEVEVRGDDIHDKDPAGTYLISAPVKDAQRHMQSAVHVGDPVTLELREGTSGSDLPRYIVIHQGQCVGVTSEPFGEDLWKALRGGNSPVAAWPKSIVGLRVEGVDTVAWMPDVGRRAGLNETGIWLRTRVVGLGRLHY